MSDVEDEEFPDYPDPLSPEELAAFEKDLEEFCKALDEQEEQNPPVFIWPEGVKAIPPGETLQDSLHRIALQEKQDDDAANSGGTAQFIGYGDIMFDEKSNIWTSHGSNENAKECEMSASSLSEVFGNIGGLAPTKEKAVYEWTSSSTAAAGGTIQMDNVEDTPTEAIPTVKVNARVRELAEPSVSNKGKTTRKRFNQDTALLMIAKSPLRLIAYHLGVSESKDTHAAAKSYETLVAMMHAETVDTFMTSRGYARVGEEDFDNNGNRIPPSTHTWRVNGKSRTFVTSGYQFYTNSEIPDQKTNIVVTTGFANGMGTVSFYTRDVEVSAKLIDEHELWAKRNNVLRGTKLRNVNITNGTFEEVVPDPADNWDRYYYPKKVRDILELEVFGFLDDTPRYNKMGITRRGILFYGDPGTGKTSIGKVCSARSKNATFVWVTPDSLAENDTKQFAVKKLYMLADYLSPGIMYLEDLDLAAEDRDGAGAQSKSLGALMNVLDGINSIRNFVTIATTNRVELMEKALTNRPGRFDRVVEVPVMGEENRRKMFTTRLADVKVDEGVMDVLVKRSDGWTGATMNEFIHSMNLFFLEANTENDRHLTMEMAKRALGVMIIGTLKKKKATGFDREWDDAA